MATVVEKEPMLDFISFNSSPQQMNGPSFYPSHYSSPMNSNRKNNNWRNNNPQRNRKFNNPRGPYRFDHSNDSFSNNSFSNQHPARNNRNNANRSRGKFDADDINQYFHPSMLEDPWAKLVKKSTDISSSVCLNDSLSTQLDDSRLEIATDFNDSTSDSEGQLT